MDHTKLTIKEQEAKRLFQAARGTKPRREVLTSILEQYQPVTKTSPARIPMQRDRQGRTSIITILENFIMPWRKIIPFGAVAVLLVVTALYKTGPLKLKPATNSSNQNTISQTTPLSNQDIDQAADQLASDLLAEDATAEIDEISLDSELYLDYESIESYEL